MLESDEDTMLTMRNGVSMKRRRQVSGRSEDQGTESSCRVHRYGPSRTVIHPGWGGSIVGLWPVLLLLLESYALIAVQAEYLPMKRSLRSLQTTQEPSTSATGTPSLAPLTMAPTAPGTASASPTLSPTPAQPTASPTPVNIELTRFIQSFQVLNRTFFTEEEKVLFELLYEGYTALFAPADVVNEVATNATFIDQRVITTETNATILYQCQVEYSMEYRSATVNVTGLADLFNDFVDENLDMVTADLQEIGFDTFGALDTQYVQVETVVPTRSPPPTWPPPTISPFPTFLPTPEPTPPLTFAPTPSPLSFQPPDEDRVALPIITSVTVLGGMAILIAIVYCTRKNRTRPNSRASRRKRTQQAHANGPSNRVNQPKKEHYPDAERNLATVPRNRSTLSQDNVSLVSDERSDRSHGSDQFSTDETKNLQDEFDLYKDQNLEELRANVEGNLSGFEGIMSAAVTKALMGDEDVEMNTNELFWGCQGDPTGAEVEASVLVEVSDWLKRNDLAPIERRRLFMQEILNKMVASVRYGIIEADDASRTIHESAALLGLQLANELPMTTVIISGMRKTVEASEIIQALSEFGDIDNVGVASGKRGFGIVRFRHPRSVERAMRRYRNAEIVVQDVAVQLKVLMPSGEVLSRA